MRPLEMLLLTANLLALVVLSSSLLLLSPWTRQTALMLAGALCGLQLWTEGYRRQLIPMYALMAVLIIGFAFAPRALTVPQPIAWAGWLLFAAATCCAVVFPDFEFPIPSLAVPIESARPFDIWLMPIGGRYWVPTRPNRGK